MLIRGGALPDGQPAHTPAESMRTRTHRLELPTGAQCVPIHVLSKVWKVPRSRIVALVERGELVGFDLRCANNRSCVRITHGSVVAYLEARQIIAATDKPKRRGGKWSKTRHI
jgi:hypothetical protein